MSNAAVWETNDQTNLEIFPFQRRIWILHHLDEKAIPAYNIGKIIHIKGDLNVDKFIVAYDAVVKRHKVLQSQYINHLAGPRIEYSLDNLAELTLLDITDCGDQENKVKDLIEKQACALYGAENQKLFSSNLICLSKDHYVFSFYASHILLDGISIGIFFKDLFLFYEGKALPTIDSDYESLPAYYSNYLSSSKILRSKQYWLNEYSSIPPVLPLPYDFRKDEFQSYEGNKITFSLSADHNSRLKHLITKNNLPVFSVAYSIINLFLYHITGSSHIVLGIPISVRNHQSMDNMMGMFVNTLPIKIEINPDVLLLDYINTISNKLLKSYIHSDYPYDRFMEDLGKTGVKSNPIFNCMVTWLEDAFQPDLENLEISSISRPIRFAPFDLSFEIFEQKEKYYFNILYNTHVFSEEKIKSFIEYLKELINQLLLNPDKKIAAYTLISEKARHQLLVDFNNTAAEYPKDKTIVDLFQEQAERTPSAIAIVYQAQQLTYDELNERSNQLAHYLKRVAVGEETLVPLCIERSIEMVVGILGILKAGGAYIPIDPTYPQDRIAYILDDTGANIIVTSRSSRSKISFQTGRILIDLEEESITIRQEPKTNPSIPFPSNRLAYVMYTSGSTGKPKGVMIEHRSLVNFLLSMRKHLAFGPESSMLSVTTYSFDIFYLELYLPIIVGGKVIIVSQEDATDGSRLSKQLSDHRPTHMQATPSGWQILLESGWQNAEEVNILTGGESLREHIKEGLTKIGKVLNLYGPTETTIWSTIKRIKNDEKVSIGQPIDNTSIYILNTVNNLCPIGAWGEICIAGEGVARGYLNRPALTAEKFVVNPFCEKSAPRIYRTGDLGRWLPDGNIEYLGRIDDQVKIRGFRIELGEIETCIREIENIQEVVAIAYSFTDSDVRIIAFYTCNHSISIFQVRKYLREKLPEYMIPAHFIEMDYIPLNKNGKINKNELSSLVHSSFETTTAFREPETSLQKEMVNLWMDILKVQKIGLDDDFFNLGGNSMLAIQLMLQIKRKYGITLSTKDFMNTNFEQFVTKIS